MRLRRAFLLSALVLCLFLAAEPLTKLKNRGPSRLPLDAAQRQLVARFASRDGSLVLQMGLLQIGDDFGLARMLYRHVPVDWTLELAATHGLHLRGWMPLFTLYDDGVFTKTTDHRINGTHLHVGKMSATELNDFQGQLRRLRIGRIGSHPSQVVRYKNGTASMSSHEYPFWILRFRLSHGRANTVVSCNGYGAHPETLDSLAVFLRSSRLDGAVPYQCQRATVRVTWRVRADADRVSPAWPLDQRWLSDVMTVAGTGRVQELLGRAHVIDRASYVALLADQVRDSGTLRFSHDGWSYSVLVIPWLPRENHGDQITAFNAKADSVLEASAR